MKKCQDQQPNNVYFNDPQLETMYTAANTNVIVGGRRMGKSHGLIAPFSLRNTQAMPGSSAGIVGTSYQQLLTRTLPGTLQALQQWGYKRDIHYFIGRKPPSSANFATPKIDPPSYDNSVIFYNGTIWRLISQDRPGTSNSLTLDWGVFDEAKFLSFDKLKSETFPAMGGFSPEFKNCPWYRSKMIVSDMPTTKKGSWFLNYQEHMDEELINTIQALVVEKYRLQQKSKQEGGWSSSLQKYYNEIVKEMANLRSVAVYYREWSTVENLALLGEKYIRDLKRELPPMVFLTSIMSKKVTKLPGGFYCNLKDHHYYTAFNYSHLDNLEYDFDKLKEENCLQDGDLDLDKPICVSFDYNANINWLVCGQEENLKMKTLKSFYVKYERKLRELVQDFCQYYRLHHTRDVVYYYDSTALGSNYAVNEDDFAATIIDEFNKQGWSVEAIHVGLPMRHKEKYLIMNEAFQGHGNFLYPMFNKDHNEALQLAMEQAGVRIGSKGFTKDKSGEKLAESEEDKLEFRTDGTDAWDTLFIGMNKFPQASSSICGLVSYFGS
jgi:hypothetical protein